MNSDSAKIKILRTVEPDEPIDEASWFAWTGAGKGYNRAEALDRARDMMRQYADGHPLPNAYKKIIDEWDGM